MTHTFESDSACATFLIDEWNQTPWSRSQGMRKFTVMNEDSEVRVFEVWWTNNRPMAVLRPDDGAVDYGRAPSESALLEYLSKEKHDAK
jgi:hypothetical protein